MDNDFGRTSVVAAWRWMVDDFKSSSHVQDPGFNDARIGMAFRFRQAAAPHGAVLDSQSRA